MADKEKQYSGKFVFRMKPELHRAAVIAAAEERVSLNTWLRRVIVRALEDEAEREKGGR